MLRFIPAMHQHLKMPAAALASALGPASKAARPTAQVCTVTAAPWLSVSNRLPLGTSVVSYSSGAGSSDAVQPSNLPSGVMSSEASAADDDTIDRMPDSAFPAGAKRTPGPDETMASHAAQEARDATPQHPHTDPSRESGLGGAEPYGPSDTSTVVSRPEEPQPDSMYPPSEQPGTSRPDEGIPHPPLEPNDPGGSHLS